MSNEHRNALPQGYQLDEYVIDRVLGSGGFGITYLAHEKTLNRDVAIKEFLPRDLAVRGEDGSTIHPVSTSDEEDFVYGLERFREEARTLVNFRHPNIIPVHRLMEANGTAYLVMEYEDGDSLQQIVEREGTLDEDRIKGILLPVLDGLAQVHEAGFLHRDIKPGNIYIRSDGSPVLIDFGAARQALGAKSRSMTAVVSVGYAPMEQYSVRGKHGTATDIYALGATAYRAVAGKRPPDAVERIENDPCIPAVTAGQGRYSEAFLAAIDWALRMDAAARPQSIAEWRAALIGEATVPTMVSADDSAPTQVGRALRGRADDAGAGVPPTIDTPAPPPDDSDPTMTGHAPPQRSKALPLIAGALTLLIAATAGATGWLWYEAREEARREAKTRIEAERLIAAQASKRQRAEEARRQAEEARRRAEEAKLKRAQEEERRKREVAEAQRRENERKRAEALRRRKEAEARKREEAEARRREQEALRRERGGGGYGLTIINKCKRVSAVYVAYRVRSNSGRWITRGWIRVRRGGRRFRRLPTRNRIIYLYARGGRLQWSARGKPGAIRRWVRSRNFAHSKGRLTGAGARRVWFHKKTIAPNTTGYRWTLVCTN